MGVPSLFVALVLEEWMLCKAVFKVSIDTPWAVQYHPVEGRAAWMSASRLLKVCGISQSGRDEAQDSFAQGAMIDFYQNLVHQAADRVTNASSSTQRDKFSWKIL